MSDSSNISSSIRFSFSRSLLLALLFKAFACIGLTFTSASGKIWCTRFVSSARIISLAPARREEPSTRAVTTILFAFMLIPYAVDVLSGWAARCIYLATPTQSRQVGAPRRPTPRERAGRRRARRYPGGSMYRVDARGQRRGSRLLKIPVPPFQYRTRDTGNCRRATYLI